MRLELILAFITSLLLLNRFVFKDVSPMLILQLTCVLIVIVIAVDYGTKCAPLETFDEDHTREDKKRLRFLEGLMKEEDLIEEDAEGFAMAPTTTTKAPSTTTIAPTTTTTKASTTTTKASTTTTMGPTTTMAPAPTTTMAPATTTKGPAGGSGEFGEDISFLQFSPENSLSFYFSVFNTKSYVPPNTMMYDIVPAPPGQGKQRMLSFTRTPSVIDSDVRNGLFLGDNMMMGPLSSEMRINSGSYTLFFMCRFDNLAQDADMIALKIYGNNTRDNNALTLKFSNVDRSNVMQTCKVSVRVGGDMDFFSSTIDNKDRLPFDKHLTYFFAIVMYHSSVEIHMSTSLDKAFKTTRILQKDIVGSVVLSNKEMEINPSKNWNVYLKTFGGYDSPLRPDDLDKISTHLFLQDKNLDKIFYEYKMQAKILEQNFRDNMKCKLDAATCDACSKQVRWDQPQSLMVHAEDNCLKAINSYCLANPGQYMCACWNRGSVSYSTKRCENLRNWMAGNVTHDITKLDDKTLKDIMKQYELKNIPPMTTAPPKTTQSPTTTSLPKSTTKMPTTTTPTRTPTPSLTGPQGAGALLNNILDGDDDPLLHYMSYNLKNNQKVPPPKSPPKMHHHHVNPNAHSDPLLDDAYDEPQGFFGWFKNLFSSGVPRDYPLPE